MNLYPLQFDPIYKAKVWGGRTLEKLGRDLPDGADESIGESWELADLDTTSPSGGGGEPAYSTVTNGPLAGQTLHALIRQFGRSLVGDLPLTEAGNFPLLVKYLDAQQNLSVQVHPDAAYVRDHPEAHLKSEAWYILDATPDGAIYKGVKQGVTPQQFRAAIESGEVESLMIRIPVKAGDIHYLPSGTCHALGAGVLVAEVQTPSDTTFRVYDWGRVGRELHIDEALACIHFGPADTAAFEPHTTIERDRTIVNALVHCEYFRIERVTATADHAMAIVRNGQPAVWMVLAGGGVIETAEHAVPFERGDTMLLPAEMAEPRVTFNADTLYLEVTFPQAGESIIA